MDVRHLAVGAGRRGVAEALSQPAAAVVRTGVAARVPPGSHPAWCAIVLQPGVDLLSGVTVLAESVRLHPAPCYGTIQCRPANLRTCGMNESVIWSAGCRLPPALNCTVPQGPGLARPRAAGRWPWRGTYRRAPGGTANALKMAAASVTARSRGPGPTASPGAVCAAAQPAAMATQVARSNAVPGTDRTCGRIPLRRPAG